MWLFDGVGVVGDDFEELEGDGDNYHEKSKKDSRDKKQSDRPIVREQLPASPSEMLVVVYHTRFWQGKLFPEGLFPALAAED